MIQDICSRAVFLWRGKVIYDGIPATALQIYETLVANGHLHDKPEQVVDEVLRRHKLSSQDNASAVARIIEDVEVKGGITRNGDKLELEITCDLTSREASDQPLTIGFQIKHRTKGRVFGSNTKYMTDIEDTRRAPLGSKGRISVKWAYDCSILASGDYEVDVCVSNYDITSIYEFLSNALEFQVKHPKDVLNHDGNLVELERIRFETTTGNI